MRVPALNDPVIVCIAVCLCLPSPSPVAMEGISHLRWWHTSITSLAAAKEFAASTDYWVRIAKAQVTLGASNEVLIGHDRLSLVLKALPKTKYLQVHFRPGDLKSAKHLQLAPNVAVHLHGFAGPNGGTAFDNITVDLFKGLAVKHLIIGFDERVAGDLITDRYTMRDFVRYQTLAQSLFVAGLTSTRIYANMEVNLLINTDFSGNLSSHSARVDHRHIIVYAQQDLLDVQPLEPVIELLMFTSSVYLHLPDAIANSIDPLPPAPSTEPPAPARGWPLAGRRVYVMGSQMLIGIVVIMLRVLLL